MKRIQMKSKQESREDTKIDKQSSQQNDAQQQLPSMPIDTFLDYIIKQNSKNQTYSQQISQFLPYLLTSKQKIFIIPSKLKNTHTSNSTSSSSYKQIQIFIVREGQKLIKYRIPKKRQVTKLKKTQSRQQQKQRLLFITQGQLLLNCIILAMTCNQKLCISLGTNIQDIDFPQQNNTNNSQYFKQQSLQNIQLYPQIQQYLQKSYKQKHSKIGKNRQFPNSKFSTFNKLTQLIIDINNQLMNIQQWINSLTIVSQILKYIQKQHLIKLEKLQVNIYDDKQYYKQEDVKKSQYVNCKINQIYKSIKRILESKIKNRNRNRKNKGKQSKQIQEDIQQQQGYFPKLNYLSFNPLFYLIGHNNNIKNLKLTQPNIQFQQNPQQMQQQLQQQQHQQQQQQINLIQSPCQTPIKTLKLISLTSQINNLQTLSQLLSLIFPYFPKISLLQLKMKPTILFQKFNQLIGQLYKYSPYIQSLNIYKNNDRINKQQGLRNILINYPYLSDLRIQLWPRFRDNNQNIVIINNNNGNNNGNNGNGNIRNGLTHQIPSLQQQFITQWKYIKQISIRKLHIQRSINMIKILQKRGYNCGQCLDVLGFMKPLQFQNIFK